MQDDAENATAKAPAGSTSHGAGTGSNGELESNETALAKKPAAAPAGGAEPAFYRRRKRRGNEICQILIRSGSVTPEQVRKGLRLQEEQGGQIGRILVKMGACDDAAIARALLEQVRLQSAEGAKTNISLAARENPEVVGLSVVCRPTLTTLLLIVADIGGILIGGGIAQGLNYLLNGTLQVETLAALAPTVVLCLIAFGTQDLYAAMAKSPPDELETTTTSTTFIFAGGALVAGLGQRGNHRLPYGILTVWWFATIVAVPLTRAVVRALYAKKPWWGHAVVLLGAGQTGRMLARILKEQPQCGLKPVMILDDDRTKHGTLRANLGDQGITVKSTTVATLGLVDDNLREQMSDLIEHPRSKRSPSSMRTPLPNAGLPLAAPDLAVQIAEMGITRAAPLPSAASIASSAAAASSASSTPAGLVALSPGLEVKTEPSRPRGQFAEVEGVPVVGDFALAPVLAERLGIRYAILAMPGQSSQKLLELTERVGGVFSHLLLIPDLLGFASLGVPARDVGGVLGIEVRQQLLLPWPRLAKRAMDIALTGLGGLLISPFLALLALAIRLDSPGPVLYFQDRLGRDGTRFRAAKFRSMYGDGEARLRAVLESNAALRAEYEEFHKLNNDPRVTRVGRFIRKFSLDELPQLWSVMNGDMSLVGPRPYLEREIPDMNHRETIILRAPPGLTGLWQVSDRNSTGFAQRVSIDVHYVRNWSPWLDIYILARTVGVVLRGTGV